MRIRIAAAVLTLSLGGAACGSSGASSVDDVDGGGGSSGTSGSSGANGSSGGAPVSTCRFGLPTCDGECVDLSEDARHCGACGNRCAAGSVCVQGQCRVGSCADAFLEACGTSCVLLDRHPDHCGKCGNACAAGSLCLERVCTPQLGSGESCADPLVMRQSKQDEAFTLVGAAADEAPLTCSDPQKRADRVFRWTAPRDHEFKARIYGGTSKDDLALEVFEGGCGPAGTKVGCNNDETATDRRPEAQVLGKAGQTYFIVVSSFGPPPAGRFYLHIDD